MKVLVTSNSFGKFSNQAKELLENNGFEVVLNKYKRIMNKEEFIGEIADAEAVILGTEILDEAVLKKATKLRIVSRYGVGIDNIDTSYLEKNGIGLTVTKNSNNEAVADYTVALMLDVCRGVSYADRMLRTQGWKKKEGIDLCNKKVGIIGLGAIGKEVAKRLKGFNCELFAFDLFYDEDFCTQYDVKKASIEDILKKAEVVTLHIPANNSSQPLINKESIKYMKNNAVLINTARLQLVDDEAIKEALNTGKLFGYGVDAQLSVEDIDTDYYTMDNVTLTPHNAAVTVEASNKMSYISAKNVVDCLKNQGGE
ncbi:phosphoglycerate dehydrogenase [Candidatus Enterococcus ferrettii]|uniref:D-3-phosphoglycerate dehydrogenase/2-oxoglutarate reductase n=1 Tax=Candidatus Enterococcus ferrettii TaxID=2815324 RepID=A0ABV0EW66_9ENTE|nr:phosphoglycerate dehydrogenase [Enterococcus sp. 665A]MBO1340142.1 phosphoglycerate dehydrogenase [Enterococcus sp. 665A]